MTLFEEEEEIDLKANRLALADIEKREQKAVAKANEFLDELGI